MAIKYIIVLLCAVWSPTSAMPLPGNIANEVLESRGSSGSFFGILLMLIIATGALVVHYHIKLLDSDEPDVSLISRLRDDVEDLLQSFFDDNESVGQVKTKSKYSMQSRRYKLTDFISENTQKHD